MNGFHYAVFRQIAFVAYAALVGAFCVIVFLMGRSEQRLARERASESAAFARRLTRVGASVSLAEKIFAVYRERPTEDVARRLFEAVAAAGEETAKVESAPTRQIVAELQTAAAALVVDHRNRDRDPDAYAETIRTLSRLFFAVQEENRAALIGEIAQLDSWRRDSLDFYQRLSYLVIGFILTASFFSILAYSFFDYLLRSALRRLSVGARIISSGDLRHQFHPIPRNEVGGVMEDFNRMVDRLAEKDRALRDAHAEAREKARLLVEADAHKNRFLANMSHELRTPLNAILGFSELIARDAREKPEKTLPHAEKILRAAEHLLDMISGLLEVARLDLGAAPPVYARFQASELLNEVADMLRPMAEKKNLALSVGDFTDFALVSDRKKARQILLNLTHNAIKYTERGETRLFAGTEGDNAWFRVEDTGIGIAPKDQELIFKDFYRVESGLTARYDGAGIGLTLSKRLVESLGGGVTLKSEPGKGSVFTVSLPLSAPKSPKPKEGDART